jgi:hypothetical protein
VESWNRFTALSDVMRVKITERPLSSPDESPMQRILKDRFSGLSDL